MSKSYYNRNSIRIQNNKSTSNTHTNMKCALFVFNTNLELFLVNREDRGGWSVPMGITDQSESYLSVAIRGCFNESSMDFGNYKESLFQKSPYQQDGSSMLVPFALFGEDEWDEFESIDGNPPKDFKFIPYLKASRLIDNPQYNALMSFENGFIKNGKYKKWN